MKRTLSLLSLCVLPALFTGAAAGEKRNNEMIAIQVVDYAGKPPFKRKIVSLPVHDVAQLELAGGEPKEYVEVKEVIMRGKPPYRRITTTMPVYDVAQFELLETEQQSQKQGSRPPFKRF